MKPADVARNRSWKSDEYDSVDDVAVGTGRRHEGAADVAIVDLRAFDAKKIDVVGYKEQCAYHRGQTERREARSTRKTRVLYKRDINQASPTSTRFATMWSV